MRRIRRRGGIALTIVIAVVVVSIAMVVSGSTPPLETARDELSKAENFARASDAGATFTRVSEDLEAAGAECEKRGEDCADIFTAAAFARVGAVSVLRCRHREIFEFRMAVREYIDLRGEGKPAPPPTNPTCP